MPGPPEMAALHQLAMRRRLAMIPQQPGGPLPGQQIAPMGLLDRLKSMVEQVRTSPVTQGIASLAPDFRNTPPWQIGAMVGMPVVAGKFGMKTGQPPSPFGMKGTLSVFRSQEGPKLALLDKIRDLDEKLGFPYGDRDDFAALLDTDVRYISMSDLIKIYDDLKGMGPVK